jgi:hypothetical protein
MAERNRVLSSSIIQRLRSRDTSFGHLHCFGVTIVGSPLPGPPRNVESFTQDSSFLSLEERKAGFPTWQVRLRQLTR